MNQADAANDIVDRIVSFSLEHVTSMRTPNGLYCFDTPYESREQRGVSLRYSLMVLLGLQTAARGVHTVDGIDDLWQICTRHRDEGTAGDLGLALWADSRAGGEQTAALLDAVQRVATDEQLAPLVGMEIAWLAIGLAAALPVSPAAEPSLAAVVAHLERRRRAPSGLYYHDAASTVRRRLPNFATEIYTVLALTAVASATGDDGAQRNAIGLADHLLRLQLDDGGWPWLFDADRARVVERYEVYSVHQDAMAPMALNALTDLTGDSRYAAAAVGGLAWSHGDNELNTSLFDRAAGFAHRSIRRRRPLDRAVLAANAAADRLIGRPVLAGGALGVQLNRTMRPYHLGWILEAWGARRPS